MENITQTKLWQKTLAVQDDASDKPAQARERLRSTFTDFRKRAKQLAGEIHRDMPEFTVHDISHLDALWEMADIVTDNNYPINPTEAFVFGGSVLLHDLGMTLAAYPDGLDSLRKRPEWRDLVTNEFGKKGNHDPTEDELLNPPEDIRKRVTSKMLRELHAKHAEDLASTSWSDSATDSDKFLIQDDEIRHNFGQVIGAVAHSHWWPVSRLEEEFERIIGAPYWCPNDWSVDPIKVAALLRIADASHIDTRRAPSFLRVLREPGPYSQDHWRFQEQLQKPYLEQDALAYTSGYAFTIDDARAWWQCLNTLETIDGELREVDALLADKGIKRLDAKRVAGVESPERLVSYIPTDGWLPIDAAVHVSDLPRVIENLGGEELYGESPEIAVRELIQNSADAVRARRITEDRSEDWGIITVELYEDSGNYWIEIKDNGIGMSSKLMKEYLLDFGSTYWGSQLMRNEYPGLLSSEFGSTGEYGIGFFSVFMLGKTVEIRSRMSGQARDDTIILEFNSGLTTRPILREAEPDEQLIDCGTAIRVRLENSPKSEGGLLSEEHFWDDSTIQELCTSICPSIDVDIEAGDDENIEEVVRAGDWLSVDGQELLRRVQRPRPGRGDLPEAEMEDFIAEAAENLRTLRNGDGTPVGRACIAISDPHRLESNCPPLTGVVTVGGLKSCPLSHIAGVLLGRSERISRDVAVPIVESDALAEWATEQARLVSDLYEDPAELSFCAQIVWMCGGHPGDLPVVKHKSEWLSYDDIPLLADSNNEFLLASRWFMRKANKDNRSIDLEENIIFGQFSGYPGILQTGSHRRRHHFWPQKDKNHHSRTMTSLMIKALSDKWSIDEDQIYKASIIGRDKEERVIGEENNSPVKERVGVIKKPQ